MARIPLQCLPAFRAAAELHSLRAAAAALHLTPSAISQQIQVLEQQLGFTLFERRGRQVLLNDAGKVFLRSVRSALTELDAGLLAASAIAAGDAGQLLRVTVFPSFAQRWLLPRIGDWSGAYPGIRLEIEASQQTLDLPRAGMHAGIRTGDGVWPGLVAELLFDFDSPLIVVGSRQAAQRIAGRGPQALAGEALLGQPSLWKRWFDQAGVSAPLHTLATFSDSGLMLQAAEQDLGLALARGLYLLDALADGRLQRLSDVVLPYQPAQRYFLVYPPSLSDWPPLLALRAWLTRQFQLSIQVLSATGMAEQRLP